MKKTKATKFPIARIKKIMQSDEEVGKIAVATPVLVSKALELFMASLVNATVEETREGGGKKMTAYHLKRTVMNTPTFDFLADAVSSVPDPVAPAKRAPRAKKGKGAEDDGEGGPAAPKAKRARKTKATAAAEEEDEDDENDEGAVPTPMEGDGDDEPEEDDDYF